jgi:two-component system sensor histidine kinase FlrB
VGRLAVLGILSVSGAFLLQRDNLGPLFIGIGAYAVASTLATTPIMRRNTRTRWPFYALCTADALALGAVATVSRGAESPFLVFMVVHAFVYGLYLGIGGGFTAALTSTGALAASVLFSASGPPSAKSEMVNTLMAAGQAKLSLEYLLAQAALTSALVFAAAVAGGMMGRAFYSEKGRFQQLLDNLAELRARSRRVLENLQDGVLVVDGRGGILQANPAAVDMLGLSGNPGESLQGTVLESAINQCLGEDPPETTELALDERIVHCRFTPPETGGGLIVVLSDITEAANLRAALEEKKRLSIVGRLSATLAHEIRNPLASVSGAAEMLASGTLSRSKAEKMAGLIVSQSRRVSELLEGYLGLARNSDDFPRSAMDLTVFAREAAESASHGFAGAEITFSGAENIKVEGNELRLGQALGNLIRNAVEAQVEKGPGKVEIKTEAGEGEARLTVSDRGPGIPRERLDRVLEPFYTTKAEGTGLGLYLVDRIARDHGGRLELENRPEGGLEASLVMPLLREDHAG